MRQTASCLMPFHPPCPNPSRPRKQLWGPLHHPCSTAQPQLRPPAAAGRAVTLAAAPVGSKPPSPAQPRWELALSHHDPAACEAEVAALIAADQTCVEAAGPGGNRPLHMAAQRARRGLPAAGAIRQLLAAGAAADARNASGAAPLHMLLQEPLSAAALAALRALLRGGASPALPGPGGALPLHTAAAFADGSAAVRVVRALVEAGADVSASSTSGQGTAMHAAAVNSGLYWPPTVGASPAGGSGLLLPQLRHAGRPAVRIKHSAGAAIVAALAAAGGDVCALSAAGLSPLHACAAHARHPAAAAAVVAALAAAGADVDAPDAGGKLTAMHHAMRNPTPAGPCIIAALAEAGASARPLLQRYA